MIMFFKSLVLKLGIETVLINFIVCTGIALIYTRVFINFKDAKTQKSNRKKEVKSVVETASMSGFFLVCSIFVLFNIGGYNYYNLYLNIFALAVYITGVFVNLSGRHYLGKNWGNNVVIYNNHTLITNGVYKIVRHPLYASIIWMIYAVGLLYKNYMVIILNTFVFIPFMTYRSNQEEKELLFVFKEEYINYQKRVGRFFPKFRRAL